MGATGCRASEPDSESDSESRLTVRVSVTVCVAHEGCNRLMVPNADVEVSATTGWQHTVQTVDDGTATFDLPQQGQVEVTVTAPNWKESTTRQTVDVRGAAMSVPIVLPEMTASVSGD